MIFRVVGASGREKYFVNDVGLGQKRQVTKEEFDRLLAEEAQALPQVAADPTLEGNRPWTRPILSDALAVHPSQIPEVMERNRRHGLEVNYEPEHGRPELKDREQRRRLMKIERCHDNDGGYGDG